MAWPDTADFPAGWSFPVGFDGTDYDGTWVLDVPNAMPGKAAALKAVWADNDWAVIQTTSFVVTALDFVSVQVKPPSSYSGEMTVKMLILDEDGVCCGDGWWTTNWTAWNGNHGSGYGGLAMSINSPKYISVGKRYTLLIAVKKMVGGSEFYLGNVVVTDSASAGLDSGQPRPVTFFPDVPSAPLGQSGTDWPGPLDTFLGLPTGWQFDDEGDLIASGFTPGAFRYPVGSNGVGTALDLNIPGTYTGSPPGFNGWWPVSPPIPAYATVSFKYQGWFGADIYEASEGVFSYAQNYIDTVEAPALINGWAAAQYEVGDVPVQLMFRPKVFVNETLILDNVVGNQRYFALLDDFQVQPLSVSDGDASDEVGMVVGGVFRWEPTVVVEDSAAAADAAMGVPYTVWLTDPEWPIWHAGSPTYLPPTDPGTAWDFLDDVAYGDQDYGVGVSGTVVFQNSAGLDDPASATDELDAPNEPVLEGRAVAFDQHEPLARTSALTTDAEGDELPTISMTMALTAESVGAASDEVQQSASMMVEDSASADDELSTSWLALTTDAATATDEVEVGIVAATSAESEGVADELVTVVSGPLAVDDAAGADELFADMLLSALSEAEASDELITANELDLGVLVSEAAADDLMTVATVRNAELADEAVAESAPLFAMPGAIAWVMNTETTAVSWYSNWQFTDMVQAGDKLLAVGPEGLSVIGGDTDAGAAITARVEYDFNEFGGYDREGAPLSSEYKKRIENFWVGYCSPGRLRFVVETYGQGYGPQTYNLEQRPAKEPRNSRVKIGRGLNSRWWKVVLTNVGGAAFEVTSLSADVAQNTRRA